MAQNRLTYLLPASLQPALNAEIAEWKDDDRIQRIWAKDASVWTGGDESEWLGWLDIVDHELADRKKYSELRDDIDKAGLRDILLMGMGGSSLCPEVLAITFGKRQFHILDSTVPAQVRAIENALDLEKTLFIVASKSGSTLEPNCFKQYFFERLAERVGREHAGRQFVAITDPGSKMEKVSRADGFRHVFYGEPEIGGRFSALSVFGMAPGGAMGLDIERFLKRASEMVEACRRTEINDNPGAELGILLGVCQKHGRDKLTIFTSTEIYDLGAWLEQLIAESTGKGGVAIIPVDREPMQHADRYGTDRVFVFLTLKGDAGFVEHIRELEVAGHPVIKIELDSIETLGQEFFRWEFATAVAGAVIGINPFNQPDVESAKIEARKITDEYEEQGRLPSEKPFFESDGMAFFTSDEYAVKLTRAVNGQTPASLLNAHLDQLCEGDYFAILAYLEMNDHNESVLRSIREKVLRYHHTATCLGFGPRFLHSTGQAYKGGPNSGVFLQITADDDADLPVPGQKYTFGVVKTAQARGDFQVLIDRGRRALRVHIGPDVASGLQKLSALI